MRTAVDTSVLLDVVVDDERFAASSEAALRDVSRKGPLVIGECVLAEIRPAFAPGDVEVFLQDWQIEYVPSPRTAALLAGDMFARYLAQRRAPGSGRVVADFLVGAHALAVADQLLARDRGYYRDYFERLRLVEP